MSTRSLFHVEGEDGRIFLTLYKHCDGYPNGKGAMWLAYDACQRAIGNGKGLVDPHSDLAPALVRTFLDAGEFLEFEFPAMRNDLSAGHGDAEYAYVLKAAHGIPHAEAWRLCLDGSQETLFSGAWKEIPGRFDIRMLSVSEESAFWDERSRKMTRQKALGYIMKEPRVIEDVPLDILDWDLLAAAERAFPERCRACSEEAKEYWKGRFAKIREMTSK